MTTSAASSRAHAPGVGTEGGLDQLLRDHPRLLDVAVAGVALVASFSSVFYVAELTGWPIAVALSLPPVVSTLWRRQAPLTVLGITLALGLLQWALAVPFGGAQVPALIALYTVARLSSRRDTRLALAGALALALISPLRQPYSDSVSTLFMALLVMVIYVLGTNVELRATYLRELEARAQRLENERDSAVAVAAAQERARIARELHDVVAHHVSVMVVQAEGASWSLTPDPEGARAAIGTIADTGRSALGELRRLLGVLRTEEGKEFAPQPGLADLEPLMDVYRFSGLDVSLELSRDLLGAPESLQLAVFRVVQECLTNVLKHAGPGARVGVTLRREAGRVTVEVRDDGTGRFDRHHPSLDDAPLAPGHGLIGIRERAALFEGRAESGPLPGGGFRVWAELAW